MKYLPAIIMAILAFGFGMLAAWTYPSNFAQVYMIAAAILIFTAGVTAAIVTESSDL